MKTLPPRMVGNTESLNISFFISCYLSISFFKKSERIYLLTKKGIRKNILTEIDEAYLFMCLKFKNVSCGLQLCLIFIFKLNIKGVDFLMALELVPRFPGKVIQVELFYGN